MEKSKSNIRKGLFIFIATRPKIKLNVKLSTRKAIIINKV